MLKRHITVFNKVFSTLRSFGGGLW